MNTAILETRQSALDPQAIDRSIGAATRALLALQRPDGHFVFELEADVSIPAEYVLFRHAIGEPAAPDIEAKFAAFFRRKQADHGGWALVHDGVFNMSSSVKAYWALKTIGDDPQAPHMRRARTAILAAGGAAQSNVFTRALLALFGFVPWRSIPVMPVEIMLLPRWFPFHLSKISYWARTVLVPMMVVNALRPPVTNARGIMLDELFVDPPNAVKHWPIAGVALPFWTRLFRGIDRVLQVAQPHFPAALRRVAITKAEAFVTERLNGEDGLGAIYPAMAYSFLMYRARGVPDSDPRQQAIRRAIEKLVIVRPTEAYCQPCVSPVWDTALACHALMEAAGDTADADVRAGLDWLLPRQVLDVKGDWAAQRPDVRPGGWAFQYANAHYPDLDDTAVVVMAMDRLGQRDADTYGPAIARAKEWIEGLQSRDGGFGAFDADNDRAYLNAIPFADHGALLDPPTEDVTARCVSMLAQLGDTAEDNPRLAAAIDYLRRTQCADGSWYGRWGLNYVYGTWSVLCALNAAKVAPSDPVVKKATAWLKSIQNPDGGWGEDAESYSLSYKGYENCAQHGIADGMGFARPDGGRRGRRRCCRTWGSLPRARSGGRRILDREAFHSDRLSARFLPALPRLREILSPVGDRTLPQSDERKSSHRVFRHVSDAGPMRGPVIAVTGLAAEARIAAGAGVVTLSGGGKVERLATLIEEAVAAGGQAIISIGIAGGVAPGVPRRHLSRRAADSDAARRRL